VAGADITPHIQPRLIDMTITDERGIDADQIDITLDDSDGKLDIPARGAQIVVAIGWHEEFLINKGVFIVDDVEHSGAPDRLTIRGRSADMRKSLTEKRDDSWHQTTVGDVIREIAERNELTPVIAEQFDKAMLLHQDQTDESDISFIDRIARQFDAIATVKLGRLLFIPIGGGVSLSGLPIGRVTIERGSGDQHRFSISDREAYTGVRAYWHDTAEADQKEVFAGKESEEEDFDSASKVKTLRHIYPDQLSAERAARADWQRIQRGLAELSITLAHGRPDLVPEMPVTVRGFKPHIDGTEWIIKRVTHRLSDAGYMTGVDLEIRGEDGEKL